MEMIYCPDHSDSLCLMKTGTKPGPSQGISFYVCKECTFVKQTVQPPSQCSVHNNRTIELQSLVVRKDQKGIRQYFRCGHRDEGTSWCGYKQISEHGKFDSMSTSSHGKTEQLPKRGGDEKQVKVKDAKDTEGPTKNRGMSDVDAARKGKENVGINSHQNAHVKANSHVEKVTDRNKKDTSVQPLTFSDLSKDMPSSSSQVDKTPFQNKSFHHYRDSPDPSKKPGKHIQRPQKESDSSDSDTDNDVQETKNLMQGLTVNDKKEDDVKKPLIDSDQRNVEACKAENKVPMPLTTKTETETHPTVSNVDSVKKDHGVETKAELTSQTIQGSAKGEPQDGKLENDARVRFRNLKEDRSITAAELNKFQISLRAVKLHALPDKGERIMSKLASYKQHIASLDRQMIALLQQYGNDVLLKEADAPRPNPHQNPPVKPQQVYVYPGAGNASKTVIVRTNQAAVPDKSGGTQFVQLPSHLSEYFAANPQAMTLYGGRMTAQRLKEVGSITTEAIDKIHKQLETCPSESTQVSDPDGLRVDLMPHQRQALAWLEWREQQHPAGGILADDMGLGKTLTMISHIMRKKQEVDGESSASVKEGWLGKDKQAKKSSKKSRATLVVAPASLVHQWAKEIEKRCSSSCLKFLVYHGPNRESNINRLCDNDVVITTYAIVSKEVGADGGNSEMAVKDDEEEDEEKEGGEDGKKKSSLPLLLRICWERIILDEAHDIKNHKSARAQSVCRLRSAFRWALTGTPIQNDLKDMYSLLRFLRFSPFDELKVWKRHIESAKVSTKRLNTLVKALLLRRTKDQSTQSGKPLVELPDRAYENIEVELSKEEQKIYDKLFQKTQSTVQAYVHRHQDSDHTKNLSQPQPVGNPSGHHFGGTTASGTGFHGAGGGEGAAMGIPNKPKNTGSQILVFLLRLRQCCSHLSLLKAHLEAESLETDGIELSLDEQMKGMMLDEGEEEVASSDSGQTKTDLFEVSTLSTKLSHVMKKVQALQEEKPTDKCVIVSQWTAMLEIVAQHLKRSKISYSLIQGNVPPKKRSEIVEDFNRTGAGAKILLVSLCAGGVGLNLIGGNHLFLLDSHWNPALESQACDRIYRIGQKKDVKIYRFICKKTIEEKIWMLQQGKLSLAKSVLSGSANKNQKLSLDDLRMLFGV